MNGSTSSRLEKYSAPVLNSFRILSKAVSLETIVSASSSASFTVCGLLADCFCVGTDEPTMLLVCGQGRWARGVCLVLILLLECWGSSLCFFVVVEWEPAGMMLTMMLSLLVSSIVCNRDKLFIRRDSSWGNRDSFWLWPPELLVLLLDGDWEGMMTAVILSLSRSSSVFNQEKHFLMTKLGSGYFLRRVTTERWLLNSVRSRLIQTWSNIEASIGMP